MNKYIDKSLITNDIENPIIHLEKMLDKFLELIKGAYDSSVDKKEMLRAFHIINTLCAEYGLDDLSLNGLNLSSDISKFRSILETRLTNLILTDNKEVYQHLFKKIKNSMSTEEYETIQVLINNLRKKIKEATDFDKDLQRRILDKLNKLQSELDRDISKLESAKGTVLTIADMVSYAHNKALKPIIDSAIDLTNAMRGIEAKSNGINNSNNILKYDEHIEDVEIIETNLIEE